MSAARVASLFASVLLFTAPLFAQTTWVVDDGGGAGVDFTTLTAAVAAASDGDRIQLHSGIYSGDVLITKGLTITHVGAGSDPRILGSVSVHGLPPAQEVRLSGLRVRGLELTSCRGAVILSEVEVEEHSLNSPGATIRRCSKVRFVRCIVHGYVPHPGMEVLASRVELTSTSVVGGDGYWSSPAPHGVGGTGMVVGDRSIVSVNCSFIGGGKGADSNSTNGPFGADGGTGLHVEAGGSLHVRGGGTQGVFGGSAHGVYGGGGGWGDDDDLYTQDGIGGTGAINHGTAVLSNADFWGGNFPWPGHRELEGISYWGTGTVTYLTPFLPAMNVDAAGLGAGAVPLVLYGEPGEDVSLLIGDRVQTNTTIGFDSPLLVEIDDVVFIGTIPANGELLHTFDAPAGWVPGDLVALQAMVLTAEGYRLSNSAAVVLR